MGGLAQIGVVATCTLMASAVVNGSPVTAGYDGLENHLRAVTAAAKREDLISPDIKISNYASPDNVQSITGKLENVGRPPIPRLRLISNLGSERIPYLVEGNITRAYFSGAAVTSPDGGPWSPFGVKPPVYPQSVQPDLAIGPPSEMLERQRSSWDVIPFNARSGEQRSLLEYFNVDWQCRAGGYKATVVQSPKHGSLQVVEAEFLQTAFIFAAFHTDRNGQPDSRGRCSLTTFPAVVVTYTSADGFEGSDTATVLIEDHGYTTTEHFVLRVLPKGG